MSAEKDKSKVHKLSLKGLFLVPYCGRTELIVNLLIGSSKLVSEFVGLYIDLLLSVILC